MSLVAHLGNYASLVGEPFEFVGLPNCAGEGLFAIDVLALGYRPCGYWIVHVVGGCNSHGIYLLIHFVEHYAEVAEARYGGKFFVCFCRHGIVNIAKCCELNMRGISEGGNYRVASAADAYHRNSKLGIRSGRFSNAPRRKNHKTAGYCGAL